MDSEGFIMTKVSVILPVYNVEEYLRQALDSIVNQTLKDIEIICVNDGSKDNSLNILEEYASKDDRVKIINQENQGQGAARNNAIKIATGEYLSFVDPDDWIEFDMYEKLYNKAIENSADLIEFSFYRNNDFNNSVQKKKVKLKLPQNTIFNTLDYPEYIFQSPRYPWNKFYKTDTIKNNNIRFGQGRWQEDQNFVISARALANRVLYYPNNYLYHYRIRINSSTNKINMDILKKVELVKELKEFLISKNLFKELEKFYNKYALEGLTEAYKRVPDDHKTNFDNDVKNFLSENQYAIYEKKKHRSKHFLENIFAIKKMFIKGNLYKVVIILGRSIPLHKIF